MHIIHPKPTHIHNQRLYRVCCARNSSLSLHMVYMSPHWQIDSSGTAPTPWVSQTASLYIITVVNESPRGMKWNGQYCSVFLHYDSTLSSYLHYDSTLSSYLHYDSTLSSYLHYDSTLSSYLHYDSTLSSYLHNDSTLSSYLHYDRTLSSYLHYDSTLSSYHHRRFALDLFPTSYNYLERCRNFAL